MAFTEDDDMEFEIEQIDPTEHISDTNTARDGKSANAVNFKHVIND